MPPVAVRILHPEPDPASGPLTRWVAEARATLAEHHRRAFIAAGAGDVAIVGGPPDDRSFGDRLRAARRAEVGSGGLVVLGSGSIPLATAGDRRALVAVAAGDERRALANNRYSADVVAISRVETLPDIPDLPGDNALPRWLEEVAGYQVDDLRRRWRLAIDIDGPLDLVLVGAGGAAAGRRPVAARVADRGRARRRRPTLAPSCSSPAGPRRRRWPGWSGTPPRGPGRGSRNAACARRRGSPRGPRRDGPAGRRDRRDRPPGPSSGRSSTATGRARWATISASLPTRRSSTAASSSPTGSVPRRPAGRPPRIASPPTCCSPSGSQIRGSASSPPRPRRRRSRSCSVATPSSGRASGS